MVSARQLAWTVAACASSAIAQSNAVIRIDDAKAITATNYYGVQYGSGWTTDDEMGAHYRGTYTSSHTAGSYMMLSFRGTQISYYADKTPESGPVMLALDGHAYPNVTWTNVITTTRQQLMWTATGLTPGDHQLVLGTAPVYMNDSGVVGLDYFSITPIDEDEGVTPQNLGPGAWSVPVNATIVDNEDPAISYSDDSWRIFGLETNGPTPLFHNGTQRSSQLPGAALSFKFRGTAVWYFSDDFWSNGNVSISVDGAEGEIVNTSSGLTWVSQRMFWSKTGLSDDEHVVTVTHVGNQGTYANLDFFMYMPGTSTPSTPSHSVPIAAIVGGVVGGVVGLGLILLGLFFVYRKRRASKDEDEAKPEQAEAGVHHLSLAKTASRGSEVTIDEEKIGDEKAIA